MDNLLHYFFENPEREYHVRELAVLTRQSPTTVSKYLRRLQKRKLLLSRRKLNHLLFKGNAEHGAYKQEKLAHNLALVRESGLIEQVNSAFNQPEAVVLFGSYAKAENIPGSDIDLLVITPKKKDVSLQAFERRLGHSIQLFQHSVREIEVMKKKNRELLNNWVNGIVLSGHWELFR